jgi:hypothetical protein
MIKLPFSNRAPKYIFKFSKSINFFEREVKDVDELVNLIEDENYRLLREVETATVIVTKIKVKTNEILFSQEFSLPRTEKVDWVRECEGFYTKKPISFNPTHIEDAHQREQEDIHVEFNEDNARGDVSIEKESEINSQEEPRFCEDCGKSIAPTAAFCQFCGHPQRVESSVTTEEAQGDLEIIKNAVGVSNSSKSTEGESEDDFDSIKAAWQEGVAIQEVKESREEDSESISSTQVENKPQKEVQGLSDFELGVESNELIAGLLATFKENADQVLREFSENEDTKIQEELKLLDKRSEIVERLTAQYQHEEAQAKRSAESVLASERQTAMQAEQKRHEEAMRKIEQDFEARQSEQLQSLTQLYAEKLAQGIDLQTQKETEQLAKILSGKKAELELRKQELNKGLKTKFEQTLKAFNTSQDEAIQQLNVLSMPNRGLSVAGRERLTTA